MTDRTKIIPYVVPSSYPRAGGGLERELGHGIHATLAQQLDHLVGNLGPEGVEQLGFASVEECWQTALVNIDTVFKTKLQAHMFPAESADVLDLILCGDSWLAASCIMRPRLHAWASEALKTDDLLVSIPNPEALLIFPKGTAAQHDAMRAKIRAAEAHHRKPLTWELFALSATGIQPFSA
jgi:hypothetical protein